MGFVDIFGTNVHRSNTRNIIETKHDDGYTTYTVEFINTVVWTDVFGKIHTRKTTKVDSINFQNIEDARFYAEKALRPSGKKYGEMFLVGDAVPNNCPCKLHGYRSGKEFHAYEDVGDDLIDIYSNTLIGLMKKLHNRYAPKISVVESYEFVQAKDTKGTDVSLAIQTETDELYAERKYLIDNEINRMKQSIKFLESLA